MNRSLRRRHAWIWIALWPIFVLGIILAITMSTNGPSPEESVTVGDAP